MRFASSPHPTGLHHRQAEVGGGLGLDEAVEGVVAAGGGDAVGMADAGAVAVGVLQGTTAIHCEVRLA